MGVWEHTVWQWGMSTLPEPGAIPAGVPGATCRPVHSQQDEEVQQIHHCQWHVSAARNKSFSSSAATDPSACSSCTAHGTHGPGADVTEWLVPGSGHGALRGQGKATASENHRIVWVGRDFEDPFKSRQGKGVPCLAPAKRRRGQTDPAQRERVTPKGGFGQRGCSEPPQDGEHWHIKARRRTGRNNATCQQLGGMR